jgi:hypothetical protein
VKVLEQSQISDKEKRRILQFRVTQLELAKVWKNFELNGFEPILIKGWVVAKYYPKVYERHLGDFDIAVSPEVYPQALDFVRRENLTKVDLHEGLRHLDSLSWDNLFENCLIWDCDGVGIRVLRPEDHLRVLAVHWLTDGGEYFEKLWDIYYLVDLHSEDFDWGRCLNSVSLIRRRWIIITIGLANKYLELELKKMPFASEAKDIPVWIIKFLEDEWQNGYRLLPIHTVWKDKKRFWLQIRKRIPPNPIQAIINVEGDLDRGRLVRLYYQIKSIFKRLVPSVKRFIESNKV